jgi:hypothetical protein
MLPHSRMNPATILVTVEYWTSEYYPRCILHSTIRQQNRLRLVLGQYILMRSTHYQAVIGPDPSLFSASLNNIVGTTAISTQV